MAKFWKSKEFESLKSEWDKKLEESGFKDAEIDLGEKIVLKKYSNFHLRGAKRNRRQEDKAQYCSIIMEYFSREKDFEDEADRLIMERIAEGKAITDISAELRSGIDLGKKKGKHDRHTILYVRRRYEHKWGIRTWTKFQMTSRKKKLATR